MAKLFQKIDYVSAYSGNVPWQNYSKKLIMFRLIQTMNHGKTFPKIDSDLAYSGDEQRKINFQKT